MQLYFRFINNRNYKIFPLDNVILFDNFIFVVNNNLFLEGLMMKSLSGFMQFAASAIMLVYMFQGEVIDSRIVDPSRYDSMGAQRVIKNDNPQLATYCVFQGHDQKHNIDIFYCGW